MMNRAPRTHSIAFALLFACVTRSASAADELVDFQRDVRPILSDHCFACHGPDANRREADLRLDEISDELTDREIIVPGSASASLLVERITSDDADERMPPSHYNKDLSAAQIATLRRWIEQGADWQQHWAFQPPRRATVPPVLQMNWPTTDIDFFTLAAMERVGLSPSPEADRRTLIRRLSLDLTGLPPTPDQVQAFLADERTDAYEQWVDKLLDSPRFGERMALAWMDQARYADTNGYSIDGGRQMWLWRDWVIDAYNRNLPFDQFLLQQLAGDLLPNATSDTRVATGFLRNHMITHEGGTIPAENLVNYVADRVKTTGEVFLGLTLGCAQCHDHKFDPITQRDYYQLFAYFNTVGDRGLDGDGGRNAVPNERVNSVFARDPKAIEALRDELTQLKTQLDAYHAGQAAWEDAARRELSQRGEGLELHPVEVIKVTSPNRGANYEVREDGTVFVPSASGRSPSISAKLPTDNVTALRIVFEPDASFPHGGLGHGNDNGLPGSLLLTSFSASATTLPSDQVDLYALLEIDTATASASHPEHPPTDSLDPRDHNGWSPHPNNQTAQHITFRLREPLHASQTPYVTVMLVWGGGSGMTGGKYRLFAVTGHDDGTNLPADVQHILHVSESDRTEAQRDRLSQYYAQVSDETAPLRHQIQNLEERLAYLTSNQSSMVMNIADSPRPTYILNRGQYDQPLEEVHPTVPASLLAPPPGLPPNRLGLAQWMLQPNHPLTARVAVNRLWQLLFGEGIVRSSADFGSQGDQPTHPALLDHLAIEFVESGWDMKAMLKRIVMSSTYRQSSFVSAELRDRDPTNRFLARGARFRLPAELIRDNALSISGLLKHRLGGPSVKPYQPANLWREISHFGSTPATSQVFVQDHGEALYRRSLYTYWKRTAPPPAMMSFDAPNREICTVQRSVTNTPLQALVLLNDPQFVEASRALAQRIMKEGGSDTQARLRFGFELATARQPTDAELAVLEKTYQRERRRFLNDADAAQRLLSIGELPRDMSLSSSEHAAWTTVASLLLNLSETITRG